MTNITTCAKFRLKTTTVVKIVIVVNGLYQTKILAELKQVTKVYLKTLKTTICDHLYKIRLKTTMIVDSLWSPDDEKATISRNKHDDL